MPCWMPHQGPFQQLRSAIRTDVHLCHERVHTADTRPPALPGHGPVPELTSMGGDVCAVTVVSALCSQLPIPFHPIPFHWPGNGHSRGAESRAWGWGAVGGCCRSTTRSTCRLGEQPEHPQVIRASWPLYTAGRALAEPWSRAAPAN